MKKIFKYIIALFLTWLLVDLLTYFITKPYYKEFYNYEILTQNPIIEVSECKNSYMKGYIKGTATNNSEQIINQAYVKAEFYKDDGELLGIEYYEIPYFNPQEEASFEIYHTYRDIGNIKISIGEGILQGISKQPIKENMDKYVPFLGLAALLYLLP